MLFVMLLVVLCPGTPEGSTAMVLVLKRLRRRGNSFKVSSDRLGEAGNRTCIEPATQELTIHLKDFDCQCTF